MFLCPVRCGAGVGHVTARRYLPSLTALRGIAAIWVVLHHLTAFFLPAIGEQIARHSGLLRNGFLCVDFFFILSGFTLAHLYRDRLGGKDAKRQYTLFLGHRLARIYPLHLVTIAAMLVLAVAQLAAQIHNQGLGSYLSGDWWKWGHGHLGDFVLNVLLLQSILPYTSWNDPAWSISAEWFAYVLFPILLLPMRLAPRANKFVCVPLVLLGLALIEWRYGTLDVTGPASVARCFLGAWLGITCYAYFADAANYRLWASNTLLLVAACLVLVIMQFNGFQTLAIVPMAVVLVCAVVNQGWPSRVLNWHPWVTLGELSFSIYMTHWVFMSWVQWLWRGVTGKSVQASLGMGASYGLLVLSVALLLPIAYVSYRYIEIPWRLRLRQNLLSTYRTDIARSE
jgi:peptidoglycan/LPS O-acetylase OafA/YrhL